MSDYEESLLWKNSLACNCNHLSDQKAVERLRASFVSFREKASFLAGEIANILPDYTKHDISHSDSLWRFADIICGREYSLNPAEAYVLGGAFLIHDLGMGLAAYPNKLDDLKNSDLWKDTLCSIKKDSSITPEEAEKKTLEIVLREEHANQAERLALIAWEQDGKQTYLIDDENLRRTYGEIIGKIAQSHWSKVTDLPEVFPEEIGALPEYNPEWKVNPLKIACILRCADASHITADRAPYYLHMLRAPNKYSSQHWKFHEKLVQPYVENNHLKFTSKSTFTSEESELWWLCFDVLKMIDYELRNVDTILSSNEIDSFDAKGIYAINDMNGLIKCITVSGWQPVDIQIKVGNVARMVRMLGGEKLYGADYFVPIRELMQNAFDAVRARRILDDQEEDWGLVNVRTGIDDFGRYIEIEDNGVGMSLPVLCGPFLDFGNSFWGSSLSHKEFPGLESKGFKSTGKYGIGFFSVFMCADKVTVTTRPYSKARGETKVLEFDNGVIDRPLLRDAKKSEYIKDGGTKIKFWFNDEKKYLSLIEPEYHDDHTDTFGKKIVSKCPAPDVNINIFEDTTKVNSICANDWLLIEPKLFVKRLYGYDCINDLSENFQELFHELSSNMQILLHDGQVAGKCFMIPTSYDVGVLTVGGFTVTELSNLYGVIKGDNSTAVRDKAIPIISKETFVDFIKTQLSRLPLERISDDEQMYLSESIAAAHLSTEKLKFGKTQKGYVTISEVIDMLVDYNEIILLNQYVERNLAKTVDVYTVINDNVIFVNDRPYNNFLGIIDWPKDEIHVLGAIELIIREFSKRVNINPDQLLTSLNYKDLNEDCCVGMFGTKPIRMDANVIRVPEEYRKNK